MVSVTWEALDLGFVQRIFQSLVGSELRGTSVIQKVPETTNYMSIVQGILRLNHFQLCTRNFACVVVREEEKKYWRRWDKSLGDIEAFSYCKHRQAHILKLVFVASRRKPIIGRRQHGRDADKRRICWYGSHICR